jgi:hypothetical protein
MALKRYRAVGSGLVSHPNKKGFVGYERVIGAPGKGDLVVPGGHVFRKLPDGELLPDSADLRNEARRGALEEVLNDSEGV